MRVILTFLFSIFFIVSTMNHLAAETVSRVVAYVNDDVITLHELNKKIEEMTGQTGDKIREQDEKRYLEIRGEILDLLINDKITQDKILELGIQVTQGQIDETIENIKKMNRLTQEDLMEGLKREGITYQKYRENIKNQLERIRLINYEVKSKIIIREEQLKQYYQEHINNYTIEEQIHIASIFLQHMNPNTGKEPSEPTGIMKDLLMRLRNGEDFGDLAREFSQGPGAEEGGDLGKFKPSQIDPELLRIIDKLPEGGISEPIERGEGVQIIKLIKREKGGVKPFEEVRDSISETLYQREVNKRYAEWIKDLRENTFTRIIF